nr:flavin reductase family protein [Pilimelia anulata]
MAHRRRGAGPQGRVLAVGGAIHAGDPFATPPEQRSPVRRLRGRIAAGVTLWTARDAAGAPAGLTVSSTVVADGEPARLLGLVDDESELWAALAATGRFAVAVLTDADRQLADRFAGLLPVPGGPFRAGEWAATPYGPVPAGASMAGCRLDAARPYGWAMLVEATVEEVDLADGGAPLVHHRGRYRTISDR